MIRIALIVWMAFIASVCVAAPAGSADLEDSSKALARSPVQGIDHIGLTVTDLEASKQFFIEYLGFKQVGGVPDYPAVFLSNAQEFITLWQATDVATAVPFDRKNNVGLHHLAFAVESEAALQALYSELQQAADVVIEFSPELSGGGPSIHMMIREPSGNRMEFVYRSPASE